MSVTSAESDILLRDDKIPPLTEELTRLYSQGFLTDVTLSTEDGKNFEAHRVLLAARSHYFHSIVHRLKTDSVIFLKGVKGVFLDKILKFMYGGSTTVSKHQLKPFLEVAKSLQIKGLQDLIPSEVSRNVSHRSPFSTPLVPRNSSTVATMDKTTSTSFKTPTRKSKNSFRNGPSDSESEMMSKRRSFEGEEEPPKPPKRKRGRPPKNSKPNISKQSSKESDPYDFDDEDHHNESRKAWRSKKEKSHNDNDSDDDEDNMSLAQRREKLKSISSINGKQILTVKCKGQIGELYMSRFASGVKGQSIKYKDEWWTPSAFEAACGSTEKKYLESIQTDYGPLKTLTASGMLKPHSRKCRCSICRGEEQPAPPPPPPPRQYDEISEDDPEDSDDEDEEDEEEDEDEDETSVQNDHHEETGKDIEGDLILKNKKDRYHELKCKSEFEDPPQIMPQISSLSAQMLPVSTMSFMTAIDQPPKISPSAILPHHLHHPERLDTPHTVYVMSSPHPHMTAPPTPQHNPFVNMTISPVQSMTPHHHHHHHTMTINSAVKQQQQQQQHHQQHQQQQHQQQQQQPSRINSVMQVRCKSTTALLFANKYESGSKGKCIQLGDEWLTPNEFEDRAGSKAKKYLSSIKCLGRPLRVYVNSGELKGSGPSLNSTTYKGGKGAKKMPQAIAPAPPPLHAPPTPSHMSSAPGLPQNLNMMMAATGGQPPILINQTSMPTSLMSNQSILSGPMTFTLTPQLEVRHSQAM